MRLRYLGNSGFLLRLGADLLVFDCCNPQSHPELSGLLAAAPRAAVFVSHRHGDHYNREIRRFLRPGHAELILSSDIAPLSGALRISPGERLTVNGLNVRAFGSTDEGVSFLVEAPGWTIFHAGDLNNWHWKGESTKEEALAAENAFLAIVNEIVRCGAKIDIAMFPVDPRMGEEHERGAVQFAQALRPRLFVPMHFGARFLPPEGFLERMEPYSLVHFPGNIGDERDLTESCPPAGRL